METEGLFPGMSICPCRELLFIVVAHCRRCCWCLARFIDWPNMPGTRVVNRQLAPESPCVSGFAVRASATNSTTPGCSVLQGSSHVARAALRAALGCCRASSDFWGIKVLALVGDQARGWLDSVDCAAPPSLS